MWPITIIAKITWSLFWLEHTAYVCEALGNFIRHNQQMKENPQDNQRSKSNIITSWIQELEYQGLFWQKYHEIDKATILRSKTETGKTAIVPAEILKSKNTTHPYAIGHDNSTKQIIRYMDDSQDKLKIILDEFHEFDPEALYLLSKIRQLDPQTNKTTKVLLLFATPRNISRMILTNLYESPQPQRFKRRIFLRDDIRPIDNLEPDIHHIISDSDNITNIKGQLHCLKTSPATELQLRGWNSRFHNDDTFTCPISSSSGKSELPYGSISIYSQSDILDLHQISQDWRMYLGSPSHTPSQDNTYALEDEKS
ncbi:32413_t:CDS:2 [Racocetra persica]|uniref:32413_t:CDS:1 n=1 Tax=Racocetra persica TaxID=160502 RepID=A0ACA9N1S5_9GLOM|nr:32413_t:CDS:2 [Racocetra persica]